LGRFEGKYLPLHQLNPNLVGDTQQKQISGYSQMRFFMR